VGMLLDHKIPYEITFSTQTLQIPIYTPAKSTCTWSTLILKGRWFLEDFRKPFMSEPLISSYLNLPVFLHFLLNPFKAIGIIELEIKKNERWDRRDCNIGCL